MTLDAQTLDAAYDAAARLPREWAKALPGEQLRALREKNKVSQRQMAKFAGVSQAVVSRLENGADARLSTWKKLFESLGIEIVITPLTQNEDWEDYLERDTLERQDRMERGRQLRW